MSDPIQEEEQRLERERYGKILRLWYAAIKNMQLYSATHPSMMEAGNKIVEALNEILKGRFELSYEHVDGLFMAGDILLIEESLAFYELLHGIEENKISKVSFSPGIIEQELIDLCSFLLHPGGKPQFISDHIRTVVAVEPTIETTPQKAPPLLDLSKAQRISDEWLKLIEKTFGRLLDEQIVSPADLSIPLEHLIDGVNQQAGAFSFLISTHFPKDLNLNHTLHSMILSIHMGHQLGLDTTSLKTLAMSALLHDAGRILLPSDLAQSSSLSSSDRDMVRLHTRDGAAFLAGVQGLPMSVVRVALEHHISFDGKGYPSLPEGQKPHCYSQIVALADFVSWATVSLNRYHKAEPPHRLIRAMMHRSGKQFDSILVKFLLPFFGLYPPGTLVKLSTGESAISIKANPLHISRPLVIIAGPNNTWKPCDTAEIKSEGSTVFPVSITGTLGYEINAATILSTHQDSPAPTL